MEMCYDGALVMPKNYVVMNEDEMTYVEGGYSKVYRADQALSYFNRQVALCTSNTVGSVIIAGATAATFIGGLAGGLAAVFMGQWASEYNSAREQVRRECNRAGNKRWLVGVDENVNWGWLTVSLW